MRRWKAAGPAPKGVEDQLWNRFRGAQDTFFGARDQVNAEMDAEYAVNAEKKEGSSSRPRRSSRSPTSKAAKDDVPRHRRAVGRRRQGAPGADQGARGADPQGRAGDPGRRGRRVVAGQPGEVRPEPTDTVAKLEEALRRPRGRPGRRPGEGRREEGHRDRG